jgi:hypothetical protein
MRSHALMAGMTFEVLAQQLGHKDTRITMRHYAQLCPAYKQESVRRNAPSVGFGSASEPSDGSSPYRKFQRTLNGPGGVD